MAQCRSCGDEVRWVWTPNDGRIPVDATPDDGGDLVLVDEGDRTVCYRYNAEFHKGEERYSSHLNECDGGMRSR
jgi:hypothetical protein